MKKILITLISVAVAIVAMAAGSKLWVHSHSGNHLSIDIADLDSIGFTNDGSGTLNIKDACGNTYKCVTIGSQVWMAENMRCNKYDTQSERAGATLSTSSSYTCAPYYTDGRNATTSFSGNLTSEQRSKLGYLYNWAAAVGFATESVAKNQTLDFSGKRQGICPNGWHVPTSAEWSTLRNYVGSNAGTKLKTTSGWYQDGNGTDAYPFAALPAGYAYGLTVYSVGADANFWTATPDDSDGADDLVLSYNNDVLRSSYHFKGSALSVRCIKNVSVQSVSLSKTSHTFHKIGESIQLTATVLPSDDSNPNVTWKSSDTSVATVSDKGLVTCTGFGDATITATSDGVSAVCKISAIIESGSVSDVCGNTYKTVKIGTQWWMAENMRCNKYDTQSTRAGATLSTSSSSTYAPYYTDASNTYNWASTEYSGDLSNEQIEKLGYLYNWAAAVGLASESAASNQASSFSGNRQGICPNGWHVPTDAEWSTLANYVGSNAGKKLKATSGWYNGGNGTDDSSFAALPAGGADGGAVDIVGYGASFWTASPNDSNYAYFRSLVYFDDGLSSSSYYKSYALSVRCVKDVPAQSISLSKTSHEFHEIRESVQLNATFVPSNTSYTIVTWSSSNTAVATVSNDGLVTCTGFGDASITVTSDGVSAVCKISAIIESGSVIDVCGNTYKTVKIGTQWWMAENMRCNKYDTQSTRAGATLSTSSSSTYAPYYTDASNTYNWASTEYSGDLSNEQIEKLGYLYNWAAAVGLASESAASNQASSFSGNRQGICPNGWHVPTDAEWSTLANYVGSNAGKKLKATSGWYNGGNGTDDSSFAALPAGYARGSTVSDVGGSAFFWTATPYNSSFAYAYSLGYSRDYLGVSSSYIKYDAQSVRCVRN